MPVKKETNRYRQVQSLTMAAIRACFLRTQATRSLEKKLSPVCDKNRARSHPRTGDATKVYREPEQESK